MADRGLWAAGELDSSGSRITGDLTVYDPEDQAGQTVTVDLRVGGHVGRDSYRTKVGAYVGKEVTTHRMLTGDVTLPDGLAIAIDCVLAQVRTSSHINWTAGQKPGGRPPVNDLPTGATAISAGQQIKQSTRGAAEAPEAACTLDGGDGSYDLPFGRSVWYGFVGTGGEVTLSTSGSDFDTVLGVYTDTGGPGEQVACVDDVMNGDDYSLQAAVTVPTDASTSYLVQVGRLGYLGAGGGPQWGNLVVARS